jgi:hypothetical protein
LLSDTTMTEQSYKKMSGKRWTASLNAEHSKLSNKENDWKLPGNMVACETRTRNGGAGRPNLERRREMMELITIASSSSSSSSDGEWSFNGTDSDDSVEFFKPPASRVIVDVDILTSTLQDTSRCMQCNGPVEVSLRTTCLATKIMMYCKSARCGFIYKSPPPAEVQTERLDKRERSTDYCINILFVLGFISCGDGGVEAARVLGLMGLPNDTTMETRSFALIENRISTAIQQVTTDILLESLIEEAMLSMRNATDQDDNDFQQWKQSLYDKNFVLSKMNYPRLSCSFDMGWQQRASGVRYNSASGHAILVGALTRKPICFAIRSKRCNFCTTWKANNKDIVEAAELDGEDLIMPDHKCTMNHVGSSGAMEPRACLDMAIDLYDNFHCSLARICCDDDASTRAMIKWSNEDWMVNNNTTSGPRTLITAGKKKGKTKPRDNTGKLPGHIPEPLFVADPNHRRKILMKELIGFAKVPIANRCTMTTMDATRLEKNFSYMIRQLPKMREDEYLKAGQAVLHHHFDVHDYCGMWCKRKQLTEEQRNNPRNKRFYRSMTKDAALFAALQPMVDRFITLDRLKEVAHGMDTQVNESFNNTFSWLAPKNKVYCGSQSLRNRLSIGIGINAHGNLGYYTRLYKSLGIIMTDNMRHFLQMKETRRTKRIKKVKEIESKKQRRKQKFNKQKRDEAIATMERSKRDGTYKTAQNMEDVNGDDEQDLTTGPINLTRKRAPTRTCKHCGKKGHSTTRSTHCLQHPANVARMAASGPSEQSTTAAAAGAATTVPSTTVDSEAEEIDDLYCVPIREDPPTDEDISFSEFQDCRTWEEDDDDPDRPPIQYGII